MRFGSLRLDILDGGRFRLDGGAIFGVIPKSLWEKKFSADERNRVRLATIVDEANGSRVHVVPAGREEF